MAVWSRAANGNKNLAAPVRPERGQAMVEFALSFSIFIMMFIGLMGLSLMFFSYLTVNNAAREGTRYLIANPSKTNADVINYVCQTSTGLGGSASACLSRANIQDGIVITSTIMPSYQMAVSVSYRVPVPTLSVSFLDRTAFTVLAPITVSSTSVMYVQ